MTDVTEVDAGARAVSRRVRVSATPAQVFDLVADPHRHHELDGSGTLREQVTGPERLSEGARFGVGMKQFGVPYRITSTVTRFEEGSLVEWQHPGGHRWRWEMSEAGPGLTDVTETFDYSTAKIPVVMEWLGQTSANATGIESTLRALADRFS